MRDYGKRRKGKYTRELGRRPTPTSGRVHKCSRCRGKGFDASSLEVCITCWGTGRQ